MLKRFELRSEPEKVVVIFRRSTWGYLSMLLAMIQVVGGFLFQRGQVSDKFVSLLLVELIVLVFLLFALDLGVKEILQFAPDDLTQTLRKLGFSRMRTYHMREIRSPHFARSIAGWPGTPSGLAFVHDGQEVRLCRTIKQEEAKQIVAAVMQQFPKLKFVWGGYLQGEPEPEPGPEPGPEPPFVDLP